MLDHPEKQGSRQDGSSGKAGNALPVLSLPKGGGAISGLGEKFSVNPSNGTASFSVPIFTTPSRSDFYPKLALSYESGSGNGPFGFGWHISVPSVTRKTDKGLPRYEDAKDSDIFILSEAEDLIPLLVESGSSWLSDVRTQGDGGAVFTVRGYRPRIEGLFARIEKWENQANREAYWKSISKDNIISVYGKTTQARIADPVDPSRVFQWLLEESWDDRGNRIRYEYKAEDADNVDGSLSSEANRLRLQAGFANKYLKNNYSQYTRESVAFATQLYVLSKNILGDQPVQIQPQGLILDETYNDLLSKKNGIDNLSDAAVQLENEFPFSGLAVAFGNGDSGASSQTSLLTVPYFCTPPNDLLLGYWTAVEKRLFNIRHCLNIKGVAQPLALFAPRINPALLVRAAALGLDLTSALNDISASTPYYRFTYMIQKALDICAEVRALGNALLSALEKKDAEHITLLRSSQETALLKAVLEVKKRQLEEADMTLAGLENSRAVIDFRRTWYQNLISTGLSAFEKGQVLALTVSQVFQQSSQAAELLGSELGLIPNFDIGASGFGGSPLATATFGGAQLATAAGAVGRMFSMMAAAATHQATMASLMGGWDRRGQDWSLQLELATLELTQIDKQILAAEIRADIAQKEIDNQQLQIDNAADVEDFLRTKFTNEDLYDWMVSKISGVFFQCYQIAYDLAKRAEASFRFELGLTDSDYIQFGYWDNLKQGLLSGEQLYLDLKRLETAYLDQNKREFEIAKSVSLVLLDSLALITLRETGQCVVNLPEALFDMDYAGHYMRRIKSLSLTIPCVSGPYTSVNCTLTLLSNKTRVDSDTTKAYADPSHFVVDFAATQSVATSSAQNDSGLFEVNFHDERYLPFEGAGVVSTWMISMPKDANAFDFESVSDVIFNLKYTSRDGGSLLRDAARKAAVMPTSTVQPAQATAPQPFPLQTNLIRYFSLKHEFPTDWYKFLHPADLATSQSMSIALSNERFPYIYRGNKIQISQVELFLKFKDIDDPTQFKLDPKNPTPLGDYAFGGGGGALSLGLTPPPPGAGTKGLTLVSASAFLNGVPHAAVPQALPPNPPPLGPLGTWTLTADQADIQKIAGSLQSIGSTGVQHLNPDVIDDIFFVCHYSVTSIG